MLEKAYKLLATQEKISNHKAKELIDKKLVSYKGKKLDLARALLPMGAKFELEKPQKARIIFEDEKLIALNKPYNYISEDLQKEFKAKLLNRLDKETSGVLLLCKDEEFRKLCIEEFKKQRVQKTYLAILSGFIADELELEEPILTLKSKGRAYSKISKQGLYAFTKITPLMLSAKKTLAKLEISTGRTHQIRVHCAFAGHGVVGDDKYAHIEAERMYLHSFETKILHYTFRANLDESFSVFGFDVKNLSL
ncbi:RNA pseudouridine synthase [Campylobacter sp. MIT 99-7217]|uniref:pseudouridine synthase family protein n=1 Tax=Campylobacter sp. MIT 99-7217 TaxID=535091 RepID=UPI00115C3752|nr:RluA family pseudouridine synthase [Campylobacter sp. MIT 99-7217]TQR33064.1 RNA pseudouridine synthase [Campylobacter sp. MIT 99-7217]